MGTTIQRCPKRTIIQSPPNYNAGLQEWNKYQSVKKWSKADMNIYCIVCRTKKKSFVGSLKLWMYGKSCAKVHDSRWNQKWDWYLEASASVYHVGSGGCHIFSQSNTIRQDVSKAKQQSQHYSLLTRWVFFLFFNKRNISRVINDNYCFNLITGSILFNFPH